MTIYLEVGGEPVPIAEVDWLEVAPCGCACGILVANLASADGPLLTAEAACLHFATNKVAAQRCVDDGYTYRTIRHAEFVADRNLLATDCPHDPKWGVPKTPVPDGHAWATTDRWRGRKTYTKHLVPTLNHGHYVDPGRALCGKAPGKHSTFRSDDDWHLRDCVECRKCQQAASLAVAS